MSSTIHPPLHGVTVLELGLPEAGQYAGRLLADLGARVITVEPLTGIDTRALPPFVHDVSGRQRSVAHEYLNSGKESVAINLKDGLLMSLLRGFEGKADVLVVGGDYKALLPADLRIATVSASLYGLAGGRADAPSSPLTRFMAGGSGSLMPTARPAAPGALAGECFSGVGIATTVLAVLLARMRTAGSPIPMADHCEQAHLVNLEKMFIGRISKDKAVVTRESHRYPFGGAVRCKDGFVSMLINERHQWKGFSEAIGRPDWAYDPRFATGSARFAVKDEIEAALVPWCASRTRAEVVEAMRSRQVPIGSVNEVGELARIPTLRARRFVRDVETPYGEAVALGLPYGADPLWQAGRDERRPFAPLLGEHTAQVLREAGFAQAELSTFESMNLTRSEHAVA